MRWTAALIVTGVVTGILAWPMARVHYHRWRARSHAAQAADFFARRDIQHAILSARTALTHDPENAAATRIMAKSAEAAGSPEAEFWRARLETVQPGDTENALARAKAALASGGTAEAEKFLDGIAPAARNSADWHAVAAEIAVKKKDTASAETHWAEAARLAPAETRYQLNLANVRLESKQPATHAAGLKALQKLRGSPATSVEALRLLLADAIRQQDARSARSAADALVAEKRSNFNDKLARLTTLRLIRDPRATEYLLKLRDEAVTAPADLYSLLMWMNANELPLMVAEWVRWMPPELAARPPVCLAIAETWLRLGEWQKLADFASASKWGPADYTRRAYLACALERLGNDGDAKGEWTDAVAAARGHGDALERLAKFAQKQKWDQRAKDILWMLASEPRCPHWVTDSLWQDAFRRQDSAQLQKLSSVMAKADPRGIRARNNYAFLSLLTHNDEGNPNRIAEELHREYPDNAMVASTYGLALFEQGRAPEAAALMAALKPEELRQPQIALYYAIFLLGAGEPEKATAYLELSSNWPMLPEEKALLQRVKAAQAVPEPASNGVPR